MFVAVPADNRDDVGPPLPVATELAATPDPELAGGQGLLEVVRAGATSVATRVRATSPLKLLTPRNTGPAAWIYASTYGGGLVDGDALRLTVNVGADAMALLATQASTKVYRSPVGTRSDLAVHIGAGGTLISIPEPVVCFAGARYRQHQTFDVDTDGSLVHLDWLSCGRSARGERWAFDLYRTSMTLRRNGRLLCHDALTLASADGPLLDRLDRFEALATMVLIGPACQARASELMAQSAARPVARRADLLMIASPLGEAGCLVRFAGVSLGEVGRAVRASLDFLPAVRGDDPWARKW